MKITVIAIITAGTHPQYGAIIKGQSYTIEEKDFAEQLFVHEKTITDAEPAPSVARPASRSAKRS